MHCSSLLIPIALLALQSLALELSIPPANSSEPLKVQEFKFKKIKKNVQNLPRNHTELLEKRSPRTVLQRLDNSDFLYYAEVSIGTPAQNLRLHLDTGSSDIWVESPRSELCKQPDNPCEITGMFDEHKSSTYKKVSNNFQISYVDGEYAQGDYGKDVFRVGRDVAVQNVQFAIGLESTSTEGIMGIGFETNQVAVQRLGKSPYPGLTRLMVEQGLIKSRAYSLWLNDLDADEGEVLFGGVDTAKFQGNLTTLPIDKRIGATEAREFMITLTSVGLTNDQGKSINLTKESFAVPVLLDTGTTYTYLPSDLYNEIALQVGANINDGTGVPTAPCDIRNYNGSVDFSFSGAIIRVPVNELVVDAYAFDGSPATYFDGTPLCYFGIMDAGEDNNVLGDTFLRSAYIVFDLDNQEISIAPAIYNATDSNIIEIGTGKNAVPDAEGATSAVIVPPTGVSGGRGDGDPIYTGNPDSTASASRLSGPSATAGSGATTVYISWFLVAACAAMTQFSF
ncbi:aspartic peptidase domain-containing protein [Pyronema domesticum]|uniref:Probable aspartic-type endopeptidase OPSB n=1 Tax=Pyronema omphalodes (strain CBS 100304) TaxID=1076935 RepID=U4LBL4_PYROM|nr:aspartic peptidase domain-containing protein [Pyronema domesticum]CCX16180.1 Similar to Probable aspartic-type endopeptidase OPSB; acc. no. D4AIS3 [Pyronema omphalodes CBS 100304]